MNLKKAGDVRVVWALVFGCFLFLASLPLALAQSDVPPPPPPPVAGAMMIQAPGPGVGGGMAFHAEFGEGLENKVVTGVPLSGDLIVTRDTTLADGNHIHNQTQTKVYRDTDGRVRREVEFELSTPATGAVQRNMVIITDPVAGKRYVLNPQSKSARVMPLHPPMHGQGPPPPDGEAGPVWAKHDAGNVTRDQLGTKMVNGLQAEGTRVTRTIPAGNIGNDKPIQVVTERWYSTDLQLPVTTTHIDPMMGTVTTNFTNINRAVPDASLFQVPSDYKVETGKPGDMVYMPMKP